MVVVHSYKFRIELRKIVKYIAKVDSYNKALKFATDVYLYTYTLDFMPYKYSKSIDHDSELIRNAVFKGYRIPYIVGERNIHLIIVFSILKNKDF